MNISQKDIRLEAVKAAQAGLCASGGKLYVWGCSATAKMVTDFIEKNSEIKVNSYIVDDKYFSFDTYLDRRVIKSSEALLQLKAGDYVVCGFTAEKQYSRIQAVLPDGVECLYFFFPYSTLSYGTTLSYSDYSANKERFERVCSKLMDDLSKRTMEAFINASITGDVSELNKITAQGQYFNELTKGKCKGRFVDLGAYVGDTAIKAAGFFGEDVTGIISFEPDERNIAVFEKSMNENPETGRKTSIIKKGSWSNCGKLYFSSSDSSSSISDSGDIVIETEAVDNVMGDSNEPVAMIKLDVEGSERESLIGCTQTIKKHTPLIASCVYHKPTDLFDIPETVFGIAGESAYELYLRYYGPDLRELVMYFVPKA